MSCTTCLVGDKTTISFSTSGFVAAFTKIGGNEMTRAEIETTVLGVTTCVEKCLSDKINHGDVDLEWCKDPDVNPPIGGDPETITITWPPKTGQTNGATYTFVGQMKRWKQADAQPNERMVDSGTFVIICNPTTPVWAPGS